MRADREISKRMREMLTQDKIVIKDGFISAMKGDLGKVLDAYFALASPIGVSIERDENGDIFDVAITFTASDIRRFDTTMDIKRY